MKSFLFVTATVTLATALAHAGCTGPEAIESKLRVQPDAQTFTELAAWFNGHHQYACAAQSYRSALKLSPASPEVFELLAESLYSAADLKASADALRHASTLAPGRLSPHLRLAAVLDQLGQKEEAKVEWQRALQIDGKSPDALHGVSQHLIAEGDYGGAIALLRGSKLDEKLTLDLAYAYGKAGMLKDAEELLLTAVGKTHPSYPLANALVTVYVNQGQHQKALETAQRLVAAYPENAEAQKLLLRLLLLTNNTTESFALAQKLIASHPRDPYLLYVCGTLERQAGDFERARKHLQLAVTLQSDVYQSHYGLGVVLLKLNDMAGAKEQLESAIRLGAPDPEVHLELATVLRKLGDVQGSERELKLCREATQSKTNMAIAGSKAALAEKDIESGNPDKAVLLYREALQATPEDALLNYKLSVALDQTGDTPGEREALERAVELDPDLAAAHNQLGYLLSRTGDMPAAEKHFREAVRAAPAFTEAWINLAATLGMEAKLSEAQQAVETALKIDPTNTQALRLRQELGASARPGLELALAYYRKGDYANAYQQLETLHKLQPDDRRIAVLLADTNLHLNKAADAIALLQPMADANSENMDFEYVYGSALIASGRSKEGAQHVEKVARASRSAEAYVVAGEALLSSDEFEPARKDLEAALAINPQLPRIYTLVGIARDKMGDTVQAEAAFRTALKANPDDFQANLYLGAILYDRRSLGEARIYLDRALQLNPTDSMARYESAMLKSASGEYQAATEELEQLAKSDPGWLEPHIALSTLYYKAHRPEDGARERQIVDRLTAEQQARSPRSK